MDGVDGDLAKLINRISSFGGFLDAVLDRYGDAVILSGMEYLLMVNGQGDAAGVFVGLAALFGSMLVNYSRARAKSDL